MDFGAIPPEINSARMYSGAGSAPMRAASAAWNLLAAELDSAATSYQSTIDVLTDDDWLGPTSATMAAAVDPYVTWMSTTGAQAEQTAAQASAAASAYEAAFAMTVPPVEVAANRAQLAMLVATNVMGQNTAAIAANEAHVRRDVGTGRRGDVWLCRQFSGGLIGQAVHASHRKLRIQRPRPCRARRSRKQPAPAPGPACSRSCNS